MNDVQSACGFTELSTARAIKIYGQILRDNNRQNLGSPLLSSQPSEVSFVLVRKGMQAYRA